MRNVSSITVELGFRVNFDLEMDRKENTQTQIPVQKKRQTDSLLEARGSGRVGWFNGF